MGNSFNYMFKDKEFGQKFLYLFILAFIAFASALVPQKNSAMEGLGTIVSLIAYVFIYGYWVHCVQNIKKQDKDCILPSLSIDKTFIVGLKYCIANTLLFALLDAAILIPAIICVVLVILSKWAFLPIAIAIISILLILYTLFFIRYVLALTCIFVKTNSLVSYFKFKEADKLINKNPQKYTLGVLKFIGCGILYTAAWFIFGAIIVAFPEGKENFASIFISIIAAIISTYFVFVTAFIVANSTEDEQ